MKKIESLVKDIYKTIEGKGGWTNTISESFGVSLAHTANNRFSEPQKPRGSYLCRLLEHHVNVNCGTRSTNLK